MGSSNKFVFDKCCFCIDLKTGCFIIGYLSLISYIIFAIASVVILAIGSAVVAGAGGKTNADLKDDLDAFNAKVDTQTIGLAMVVFSVILILIVLFLVTFVIVLLVGLHKNKPGHVKAYLIYVTIFLVLSLVHIIVVACSGHPENIVQYIINFIINLYFLLVIRSQYIVMKENPAGRGPAIYTS